MGSNLIWTKFIGLWCVLLKFRFFFVCLFFSLMMTLPRMV